MVPKYAIAFHRERDKSMTMSNISKLLLFDSGVKFPGSDQDLQAEFSTAKELIGKRFYKLIQQLKMHRGNWNGALTDQEEKAFIDIEVSHFFCNSLLEKEKIADFLI